MSDIDPSWEEQYKEGGLDAQRRYPSEGLARAFARLSFLWGASVEVGAGNGRNLPVLSAYGKTVGLEQSPTAVRLSASGLIVQGDYRRWSPPFVPWVVVDCYTLQHEERLRAVVDLFWSWGARYLVTEFVEYSDAPLQPTPFFRTPAEVEKAVGRTAVYQETTRREWNSMLTVSRVLVLPLEKESA